MKNSRLEVLLALLTLASCTELQQAVGGTRLTETVPEPPTPLSVPSDTMVGARGAADAPYPSNYRVTVKHDGTIDFPQRTMGRIKGAAILIGGEPVVTISPAGSVKGPALKHVYQFNERGELLDEAGNGVRISSDGGVRAIGGAWSYQDVMRWAPEAGSAWDGHAWRTLAVVALVVIENTVPQALGETRRAGVANKQQDAR